MLLKVKSNFNDFLSQTKSYTSNPYRRTVICIIMTYNFVETIFDTLLRSFKLDNKIYSWPHPGRTTPFHPLKFVNIVNLEVLLLVFIKYQAFWDMTPPLYVMFTHVFEKHVAAIFRTECTQVFRTSWKLKTEAAVAIRKSVTIHKSAKFSTLHDLSCP